MANTLYFYPAVDDAWTTTGNWFTSSAHNVNTGYIPSTGDTAYIMGGVGSGPGMVVVMAYTHVAHSLTGNGDFGVNLGVNLEGPVTFNYGTTSGHFAYNEGILGASAEFYSESYNDTGAAVGASAQFRDSSKNFGTVGDYAIFYESAFNDAVGTVGNYAVFGQVSVIATPPPTNYGVVGDHATFYEDSTNEAGAQVGNSALFAGTAAMAGYYTTGNLGTALNYAYFYSPDYAGGNRPVNWGVVGNYATFDSNVENRGTAGNSARFFGTGANKFPRNGYSRSPGYPPDFATVGLGADFDRGINFGYASMLATSPMEGARFTGIASFNAGEAGAWSQFTFGAVNDTRATVGIGASFSASYNHGYASMLATTSMEGAKFYGTSRNSYPDGVTGDYASFADTSYNANVVADYATFSDFTTNTQYGTVGNYAHFSGRCENDGIVGNNAHFSGGCENDGIVGNNATFDDTANCYGASSVVGNNATFNTSSHAGTNTTVGNHAVFNGSSHGDGTVGTDATFNTFSYVDSSGQVGNRATFNGSSRNNGTATTATFNGSSCNNGTATTATFNGSSYNNTGGTPTVAATFNGSSYNKGAIP